MNGEHQVFFHYNFIQALIADLEIAKARVLLQSPFIATKRFAQLKPAIEKCQRRQVRICVFLQRTRDPNPFAEVNVDMLQYIGIHVTLREKVHEKLAVIDELIAYDGSLNILSFDESKERMTRWVGRDKANEIVASHALNTCESCINRREHKLTQHELIGMNVCNRRKELGLTQLELAAKAGVSQTTISKIEAGDLDVKVSTLCKLHGVLDMKIRSAAGFKLPSIDEIVNR